MQIAHSGTVAGLIFDARRPDLDLGGCLQRIAELGFAVTDVIEPAYQQLKQLNQPSQLKQPSPYRQWKPPPRLAAS